MILSNSTATRKNITSQVVDTNAQMAYIYFLHNK